MDRAERRIPSQSHHHAALRALVAVILALVATDAWAVVLYKLTDATGAVTYADAVPRGFQGTVEPLEIDTTPGATRDAVASRNPAAALAEYERIIRSRPDTSVRDRQVQEARARVEAARAALDMARTNPGPEDWIPLGAVGRGSAANPQGFRRILSPEYEARIGRLEHEVRLAEEALREAERG